VPPLAFLCIALLAVAAAALPLAWAGGSPDPLPVVLLAWAAPGLALLVAWAGFARDRVPLTTLLRVPRYLLWKLPVYWRFLRRREQEWIRTPRAPGSARDDDDPAA
jgi:hypothetical protein